MKRVEVRRRMLRRLEIQVRNLGVWRRLGRSKNIGHKYHRRMERYVGDREHTGRLRRNHALAAIVTLIGWVTRHGTTALHALLIHGHGRHAIGKLQKQYRDHGQHDECVFPKHLFRL